MKCIVFLLVLRSSYCIVLYIQVGQSSTVVSCLLYIPFMIERLGFKAEYLFSEWE